MRRPHRMSVRARRAYSHPWDLQTSRASCLLSLRLHCYHYHRSRRLRPHRHCSQRRRTKTLHWLAMVLAEECPTRSQMPPTRATVRASGSRWSPMAAGCPTPFCSCGANNKRIHATFGPSFYGVSQSAVVVQAGRRRSETREAMLFSLDFWLETDQTRRF